MHGLVDAPFGVEPVLLDIEELNRRAHDGELDLTKLSFGASPACGDRYRLLRSGAALGHGVGPLVVAREQRLARWAARASRSRAARRRRSCSSGSPYPEHGEVVELRYDGSSTRSRRARSTPGLIIHESRFTYADHGLVAVADLGEWWEGETGLPVPLAGICAARGPRAERWTRPRRAIRASVEYAFAHPEASREYVRAHSQEMSDEVCDQHIALYVNEFSVDLGDEGLAAIERLRGRADRS